MGLAYRLYSKPSILVYIIGGEGLGSVNPSEYPQDRRSGMVAYCRGEAQQSVVGGM